MGGYRIREFRESMGLTQEQLAQKSGISRATIVALERDGIKTTTTKTLLKLAQALGVTVDCLFFANRV